MKNLKKLVLIASSVAMASGDSFGAAARWEARAEIPSWVEPLTLPELDGTLDGAEWGDSRWLLVDEQVRAGAGEQEVFHHHATQVITTTGVNDVSQILVELDPSYQHVLIHGIWIHREGARIDALDPSALQVIQRETDLERRIYDGSIEILAVLPDVRVGDVVEWSWTVRGTNPAMQGQYVDVWLLGYQTRVARHGLRLLWMGERALNLFHRNTDLRPNPRPMDGGTEYRWEQNPSPAVEDEDERPSWSSPYPVVYITTYESWGEVASWARKHYRPRIREEADMPAALQQKIELWRREESAAGRVEAALRFVQDEVRYLGIEVGEGGYIPHDSGLVFERRFGDCKDKAVLLVSILRALGVEAHPALVDTDWRRAVTELPPTPYAFDHVITLARIDGREVWMDATRSLQRGALFERSPPPFQRALVIEDGTEDFVEIPVAPPALPQQQIVEEYVVAPNGSVKLNVTTTSRGDWADRERGLLARRSREETARNYLNFYAKADAEITSAGPLRVEDDERANIVTVRESYQSPRFWRDGERYFEGWSIDGQLVIPDVRVRSTPLRMNHPVWLSHIIRVRGVGALDYPSGSQRFETEAIRVDHEVAHDGDGFELKWDLHSLADHVETRRAAAHIEVLEDIYQATGYTVRESRRRGGASGWWIAAGLGLVGVVGLVRRSRRGRRFVSAPFRPGESPQTAASGPTDDAIATLRCSCGSRVERTHDEPTRVQYEGSEMLIVPTRCPACAAVESYYVRP